MTLGMRLYFLVKCFSETQSQVIENASNIFQLFREHKTVALYSNTGFSFKLIDFYFKI